MAQFYRIMLVDGDHPVVGDRKLMLGVRVGKPPKGDVELTDKGTVRPGTGGMSVVRNWRDLPHFLIPRRLDYLVPADTKKRACSGDDEARCWRMGDGGFVCGQVSERLLLRLDSNIHGLIEPANELAIGEFQAALAETCDSWTIDET